MINPQLAFQPPLDTSAISKLQDGRDTHLTLQDAATATPMFQLHVVDVIMQNSEKQPFGVLLLPQGREHEYMFADPRGRRQLVQDSTFSRLAIVSIDRESTYSESVEIKDLQDILSPAMVQIQPNFRRKRNKTPKIPYLATAEDMGIRKIVFKDNGIIVEDVKQARDQQFWTRRLVFESNHALIQSELQYYGDEKEFNFGNLCCEYQIPMIASLAFLEKLEGDILIVGVGGGNLAMFLHEFFVNLHVNAVELDENVVNIASEYFGLNTQSDRMSIHIANGLTWFNAEKNPLLKNYEAVIIDVDAKDPSVVLNCPPEAFVNVKYLRAIHNSLIEGGLLLVNVACRDDSVQMSIFDKLKSVFQKVYQIDVDEYTNRVYVAISVSESPREYTMESVLARFADLNLDQVNSSINTEAEQVLRAIEYSTLSRAEKKRARKKKKKKKKQTK